MGLSKSRPSFWIGHIPIGVLFVFWAVYLIIEIAYCRYDVLTSTIPIGLFMISYLFSRKDLLKEPKV
jgi:hypothetical protein